MSCCSATGVNAFIGVGGGSDEASQALTFTVNTLPPETFRADPSVMEEVVEELAGVSESILESHEEAALLAAGAPAGTHPLLRTARVEKLARAAR